MKKIVVFLLSILSCGFITAGVVIGYADTKGETAGGANSGYGGYTVNIGDEIVVQEKSLSFGDETKKAGVKIISPSGACYGGERFCATEAGIYTVVYSAYFEDNGKTEEVTEEVEYLCVRKSTDFFEYNDSVVAFYGSYRHNTAKVRHQGVYFDIKSGAEIKCNALIDVKDLNLDKPIIDFIVDPTTIGVNDFTNIKIRIEDAYDENSYVDIFVVDGGFINSEGASICARAGFNGSIAAGYEAWVDQYITTRTGTSLMSSFHGYPAYEPTHTAKFYLDYATKTVYGKAAAWTNDQLIYINDLTNKRLYKFNPWEGFSSNKVKVSLYPSGFNNVSGRILIKSIAGIDFSTEMKEDTVPPSIIIDYDGQDADNLPDAVVGKPYKIFAATAEDNYDIDVPVNVSVTYFDGVSGKRIDVNVSGREFIPEKSGVYTVLYEAEDRSGNVAESKKLKIYTSDYVKMSAACSTVIEKAESYHESYLPTANDLIISGGVGKFEIARRIYSPSGTEIVTGENVFTPYESGKYKVVFTIKDYLGEVLDYVYELEVKPLSKPVFIEKAVVPQVFIKGYKYTLESPLVADMKDGQIITQKSTLKINGKTSDGEFTADGNAVGVVFDYAGYVGNIEPVEYEIPVVDVKGTTDQAAYFSGNLTVKENVDDVAISAVKDGSAVFASKLGQSDLSINMTTTEKNNFGYLTIKLTDATDPTTSLTFRIDVKGKTFYFGKDSAAFSIEKGFFSFRYKNHAKRVSDILGNELTECTTDDSGRAFGGFKGGVYVTFGFEKVTGASEVLITKICNQALGTKERNNPTDSGDPIIELNEDVKIEQFIGDDFEYPSFSAYDVLSEITATNIEIKTPDNKTYTEGTFKITEYGRYKIYYYAEDSFGNFVKIPKTVFVNDDSAPEVTVDNVEKTEYKVGDIVTVPAYAATDNLGYVSADVILILPDNQARLLYHDENGKRECYLNDEKLYSAAFRVDEKSFRLEQKGTYRIRYVIYDKQLNTTVKEIVISVK